MAGSAADSRPLSPYVTIWRWHITMFVSIMHRVAGVILYVAIALITLWLAAAALGPDAYDAVFGWAPSWLVWTALYLGSAAVAFHLANGIRHLVWDVGAGFKPSTASFTAWLIVLFSLLAPVGLYFLRGFA
jgi:succinate dehydrogenase / fumarate reductase cytochrome b subunit